MNIAYKRKQFTVYSVEDEYIIHNTSMEDFAHKMLTMGLQSLVFAIIPTVFSVIIVYIFSKLFIVKN